MFDEAKGERMPTIRCIVSKDGKLIPSSVEFTRGETIRFESDESVHLGRGRNDSSEIRTLDAFVLSEVSVQPDPNGLHINFANEIAILFNPPPNPPGVIIVVGHPKGGGQQQAGAAGAPGS
jgi:hypothetical protein